MDCSRPIWDGADTLSIFTRGGPTRAAKILAERQWWLKLQSSSSTGLLVELVLKIAFPTFRQCLDFDRPA